MAVDDKKQAGARPAPNLVASSAALHWRLGSAAGLAPLGLPAAVTGEGAENAAGNDSALRASLKSLLDIEMWYKWASSSNDVPS